MGGSGIVSCVIRFICHIPAGMTGVNGIILYNAIKNLGDIYDVIPFGRNFLKGSRIVGAAGLATFIWNFLMFGASASLSGIFLAFTGVVDTILVALLLTGAVLQSQFLPHTYGPCHNAENWKNGTDGRNFFVVLNETGHFDGFGTYDICKKYTTNWVVTFVVIAFYLICASVNMLLGFSDALSDRARAKRSCGGFLQFISDCCLCLVFPVLVPALYVFRYLRGSANVSRRYLSKYWKRNRDPIAPKTTHPKPWTRGPPSASEKVAPIPPHLPLELVTMITKDLHYADLLNIGCSSKYLRTVFFANHNPRQGAQKLRQFVCKDGQPLENCAICRIQICSGCRRERSVPELSGVQHLTECRPTCLQCFFKKSCAKKRKKPANKKQTFSYGRRDIEMSAGAPRLPNVARQDPTGMLCTDCCRMTREERLVKLEKENMREVQRLGRLPLACHTCKQTLPGKGVRWWVDPGTGSECKWEGHPGWV